MEFKDKVIVITGATGGIGAAVAKKFAEDGAKLALLDLDAGKLQALAVSLSLNEGNCSLFVCDVRDEERYKNCINKTKEKFSKIDVFCNNAGVEGSVAPIHMTVKEDLDFVLDVNVKGAYFGLKYVLPIMYEQKYGSVINTASVAGFIGSPGMAPYIASKHALIGLTKTAALEAAPFGVRVNAVCPGPVDNDMMRHIEAKASPDAPEAVKEGFAASIPFLRYASNEEIADLVLFFASEKSKYITGTAQRIDGGMGAK